MSGRRLASDAFWIILGRIGIGLALILTTRALTEQVSPEEYGYFALQISLSGLAFNIAFQPMNQASQRFIPPALNDDSDAGVRATLLRLMRFRYGLAAGLTTLGYLGLTYWGLLPFRPALFAGVVILTLVTGHRSLYTFMLEAKRNQKLSSLWKVVEVFLKLAAALAIIALIGASAEAILIGFCLGFVVPSLFFLSRHRASQFSRAPEAPDMGDTIRRFTFPLAFVGTMTWFIGFSDRFVLSAFAGADQVGIYYAAYGLVSFPMLQMGGIFSTLIQPIFFRHQETQQRNLLLWLGALSLGLLPVLICIWLFSGLIAQLFLGAAFRAGADLMIWIAAGYGLLSLNMALDARILANQNTKLLTAIMVVAASTNLGLNLLLVPERGAEGAAIATFLTFACQFTLSALAVIYLSKRQRPTPPASTLE